MKMREMRKLICYGILSTLVATHGEAMAATNNRTAIPWSQIGARAAADYTGNGLDVTQTTSGTRLHCIFQRLEGDAATEGLWLTSTVTNELSDRFRVMATAVGGEALAARGTVMVTEQTVRFARTGLLEEYSVSTDGVRQDFVVTEKPPSSSALRIRLSVIGARIEPRTYGAVLVLEKSGRRIAYNGLHATDAKGNELSARIETEQNHALGNPDSAVGIDVVVNDAGAVYPVRIDPTFSDASWISLGGALGVGDDGEGETVRGLSSISAAVVDNAGNLYVAGSFSIAGSVFANNVAKWNGSSWSALGAGVSAEVYALAVSGTNLYVGGPFTDAGGVQVNGIARWDGSSWSALGSGFSAPYSYVYTLAVSGTNLYVGGDFTNAGGVTASNIAKWNGSAWSSLGPEPWANDEPVSALAVSGNTLFAGGNFVYLSEDGQLVYTIYQWNGNSWSLLGTGLPYYAYVDVRALAVSGTNLFVGGTFGTGVGFVARWNGISWSDLGLDGTGLVNALAVAGTNLFAAGSFTNASTPPAYNIAQWNGSSWSALGTGISGGFNGTDVRALAVSSTALYAGGSFYAAGNLAVSGVASWSGSSWSALGSGIDYNAGDYYVPVSALATSSSNLYVGGIFSTAGNAPANNIAQWNGSSWSGLDSGVNGGVYALTVSGTNLYAGGHFSGAGGTAANNIARWNGVSWSALGSGISGISPYGNGPTITAIAVSGTNLYVAGQFSSAGGTGATNIAQWNGTSWSALGSGINGFVYALAVSGTNLYAGGYFSEAGGTFVNNIAKWNGSSWSALGSGASSDVYALAVSGNNLYVGGGFADAGGVAANNIAKWNGTSWAALGSGIVGTLGPSVYTLAVSGNDLVAGGNFSRAGGLVVSNIAVWDGSSWSALGSGISGGYATVYALSLSGSNLFAGGQFTTAGTNVSVDLAEALLAVTPSSPTVTFAASPTNGEAPLTVQFNCPEVDSEGNTITQWNWIFGDGAMSTNQNPPHVYAIAGTYYPTLFATNNLGQTAYGSNPVLPLIVNTSDCAYENLVNSMSPIAYYRLNERSGSTAYDFFGGHNGAYESAAIQGDPGVPDPPFFGFEANNLSVGFNNMMANSWVFAPFGTLGLSNVTFTAWIYPVGVQKAWAGIIYDRSGDVGGISYYSNSGMIGYTWGANNSSTWNWASGLILPTNLWSLIAVTISPTQAIIYVSNTNGQYSATNAISHTAVTTGNNWRIGNDALTDPGRTFNGLIDEVAIFPYSLTPTQVSQLYKTAVTIPQANLAVARSGQNISIGWSSGILQSAPTVTGPWTSLIGTNSPYFLAPTGTQQYFRVKLP